MISLPQTVRKPVLFKKVPATRAATRGIPDFNPVRRGHGANRFYLDPAPRRGWI